jgi:hypothetical protein
MTKRELLARLERIIERDDSAFGSEDRDHREADAALLKFVDDPRITKAFKKIQKWYG